MHKTILKKLNISLFKMILFCKYFVQDTQIGVYCCTNLQNCSVFPLCMNVLKNQARGVVVKIGTAKQKSEILQLNLQLIVADVNSGLQIETLTKLFDKLNSKLQI